MVMPGMPVLIGASLLIMSFALLGAWGALYALKPELHPTASRAAGMGMEEPRPGSAVCLPHR
ncbi:hypothetical protein ABIE33_005899 [Ensifer sp. 4252]